MKACHTTNAIHMQILAEQQAALQGMRQQLEAAESSRREQEAALSRAEAAAAESAAESARLRDSLAAERAALVALQQVWDTP